MKIARAAKAWCKPPWNTTGSRSEMSTSNVAFPGWDIFVRVEVPEAHLTINKDPEPACLPLLLQALKRIRSPHWEK